MQKAKAVELLGYFGATLLIGAYFLVSFDVVESNSLAYQGMNLLAAIVYGFYAVIRKVTPVLVVQLFWGTIGLVAILRILL